MIIGFALATILISKPALQSQPQLNLVPAERVYIPSNGGFDYMAFDASENLVLASHTGAQNLVAFHLNSKELTEIPTGEVNGLEVVHAWNRIYAGGGGDVLCAINEKTLKIEKKVTLAGHGDALAIDTKDHLIFQCHDDNPNLWVFDARNLKLKGEVKISGVPEYIVYVPKTGLIYQNIKDKNEIDVINPHSLKVIKTWSTGPLQTPSGLVYDPEFNVIVCTGRNGIAESFDPESGKMVGSAAITDSIDQSALDPSRHIVYSAGHGNVTAVEINRNGLLAKGSVSVSRGAHTLTVDPNTHDVWICFSEGGHAYIQVLHAATGK